METVKLIIDRKPVEVPKGTTILDAAKGMVSAFRLFAI